MVGIDKLTMLMRNSFNIYTQNIVLVRYYVGDGLKMQSVHPYLFHGCRKGANYALQFTQQRLNQPVWPAWFEGQTFFLRRSENGL